MCLTAACASLSRQDAGLTLLPSKQQKAHSRSQVLQLQVGQEAPLELRLHRVAAGTAAAPQENHGRLAQQPIHELPHARAVLIGQGLLPPQAEVQDVGGHTGTGALENTQRRL